MTKRHRERPTTPATPTCWHLHTDRHDLGQTRCIDCGRVLGERPTTDTEKTTARLTEIPTLAAECWLTRDAPNPTPRASRTSRPAPGSRSPTALAQVDIWRLDDRGHLAHLWAAAVEVHAARTAAHLVEPTLPYGTWQHTAGWLATTQTWWETQTATDDHGSLAKRVATTIERVHNVLAGLARAPHARAYPCTHDGCPAKAWEQPGGQWLRCENGHQVEGIAAARRRLQRRGPMTARQIQDEHGIKAATIRQWKARGLIEPVGQTKDGGRGRPVDLWSVWDVLGIDHAEKVA